MLNEILLSDCIMPEIQFSINSSNDEISNGGIDMLTIKMHQEHVQIGLRRCSHFIQWSATGIPRHKYVQ